MQHFGRTCVCTLGLLVFSDRGAYAEPPFFGTIFIDPDIITSADTTTFQGAPYAGQGTRTMFDRRVNDWVDLNAYLFNASFHDGLTCEIQVNPEFGSPAAASVEALKYGEVIGRLPTALREGVQTVWIHLGTELFGGGNNNLLIHTGQAALYEADGILEETFVHEASHSSLDATHATSAGWLAAQAADNEFISTYARDYPDREDIAESFLPYLAVRYQPDRISASLADTISQTIPNRIDYFDNQSLNMYPLVVDLPGDYNQNYAVDAADYVVWRNMQGAVSGLPNDPLGGTVGSAHYTQWRTNFGEITASGPLTGAAVPEPATLPLLLIAILPIAYSHRT